MKRIIFIIIFMSCLFGCNGPDTLKISDRINLGVGQYVHVYLPQGIRQSITYGGMPDENKFIVAMNGHNNYYNIKSKTITLYSGTKTIFKIIKISEYRIVLEVLQVEGK